MGSEVNIKECGSAAASPTLQELIFHLRTSFSAVEFQNVAKILSERQDHMQEQCNELRKKAEAFEQEKGVLFLENQKLNNELKKRQTELDALRKENLEYKDQIKVLSSEKCRVSKSALEDELKLKQSEIDALKKKMNAVYEEKEAELRFYKNQSTDLSNRVSKLEKTAKELMSSAGSSSIELENQPQKNCAADNMSRPPLIGEKKKIKPKFQDIIKIDDDDDDDDDNDDGDDDLKFISTKRKRVSKETKRDCDTVFVDKIQTGTQNRKNLQDLHNQPIASNSHSTPHSSTIKPHVEKIEPRNLMSSLDSSASIPNLDAKNIDEVYKLVLAKRKMKKHNKDQTQVYSKEGATKKKWGSIADMSKEFDKDDELCMNAVCALYRKSFTFVPLFDKSRITQLVHLLTDGDPQQKLKKKASELSEVDVDDCRRFAWRYATQLFNIYQKKNDHFFPPFRS